MDSVLDYNNFEVLKSVFNDRELRQSVRLLCVFGCSAKEVIFATNDDKVYGFGRNRFGGLGLATIEENIESPRLNTFLTNKQLSDLFCGFEHWIALTASGQCFSWGNNEFGQLGIGTFKTTQTPQHIKSLDNKKVVDISCGGFYNLVLTSDGKVYGWGHNQFGQLGDNSIENVILPKQIHFNEKIGSLSCGIKHSMVVTITGRVYVFGLNSYGQLGRYIERPAFINDPKLIHGFEDMVFAKAVCGPNHSLVLTIDGYVYAFGDNKGGQIGNGEMDRIYIPFKVSDLKFKDIIAHKENDISIAVSIDNKFYVWGLANNRRYLRPKEIISGDSVFDIYAKNVKKTVTFKTVVINNELKSWERINQNCLQTNENSNNSKDIKPDIKTEESLKRFGSSDHSLNLYSNENNGTLYDFIDIEDFNYYELMSINVEFITNIRLFCVYQRGNSVIFVTKDDKVFGMGFNRNGGLGLDLKRENIHKPEMNTILSGKQLVDIAFGFEHSIGLTATGDCYSWGQNNYGQLGIGSYDCPNCPQKINEFNDKSIIEICCGAYHSMALTSDGELYSWGHNTFAQLGDKTYNSREIPTQVLIRETIRSITCGLNHSIALTVSGQTYIWGTNEFGQLGRHKSRDIQKSRQKPMNNRPQRIQGMEQIFIKKAVCGPNHSLLLTSDGSVYTFGDNSFGQIGNGSTLTQFTPYLLCKDIKFKDIVSNRVNDFSIAISEDNKVYVWGKTQNNLYLRPHLLSESFGKSLFDIYLKLAKEKVTFKALNIKEDIIELNKNNNNVIDLNIKGVDERSNQSNNSSVYNSSENLNDLNENNFNYEYYMKNEDLNTTNEVLDDSDTNYSTERTNSEKSCNSYNSDTTCGQVFLRHLRQSFNNQIYSDLKFIFGDKVIYCHKTILQIRNENFWHILSQNLNQNNEIRINPNTYDSFYAFLQYMYAIEPEISVHCINDLRKMAKHFNEPEFEDLCEQHIQQLKQSICTTNVCAFYERAIDYSLDDLENYCIDFISKDMKTILKSEAFDSMNDSLSKQLINSVLNFLN